MQQQPKKQVARKCWCGYNALAEFSPEYALCEACGTLVCQVGLADEGTVVRNDDADFYGKNYWLGHMADDFGMPKIQERARLDLPERCSFWLRHMLSFRLPPARALELGAAHGGFVAMMSMTGYDALGQEMSPWVADFARATFRVPMLLGRLEQHSLTPGSLDVIVANDVMEHFPDPLTTLSAAVQLLGPNGILIIQTPDFVEGTTYAEMVARNDRFLEHMRKSDEHLYLYSRRAARLLLSRLGLDHVEFCPAIYDYDMYFVASRQPVQRHNADEIAACLESSPQGRLVLALLDKGEECRQVTRTWQEAEADRAVRLEAVKELEQQLSASEVDRAARLKNMQELDRLLAASEADSNARLRAIMELSRKLLTAEGEQQNHLQIIQRQDQIIKKNQATIRALRKALRLPESELPSGLGIDWKGLSKKFAKMLLPKAIRSRLRERRLKRVRVGRIAEKLGVTHDAPRT
ncbi:MAG TPA: class I SAM-dependent methyltransferase [Gemmataceae bacterium]|nr:class I SAM-dependent methyltransferase [Gemmataceae bacterium]